MGNYAAYSSYKDSGVEWLGEIPEHWKAIRLKHITNQIIDGSHFTPTYVAEGVPFLRVTDIVQAKNNSININNIKFIPEEEHKILSARCSPKKGDLLYSKNGTIGIPRIVDWDFDFSIFVSLCLIKIIKAKITIEFLQYSLLGKLTETQINIGAKSNTVTNLHLDKIKEFWVSLPPLDEQKAIAAFLDYKTQQIDQLIAKKESLLEKLDEKRTALISHAVIKGLDPTVPMKDSGVEWLGEIPEHWEVKNLRYACEFLNRKRIPLSSEERGSMTLKKYAYYGASGIIDYVEDFIFNEPTILIAEDGANLLSRSTPLAFIATGEYWVNNHAHILKPFLGNFIYWSNLLCIINYDSWITGSAQPKLTKDNLGGIKLPCPPLDEQDKIAQYLDKKTAEIDQQKAKILQAIDLLKEYRTALITNAVTGQIDVRSVPIPTP